MIEINQLSLSSLKKFDLNSFKIIVNFELINLEHPIYSNGCRRHNISLALVCFEWVSTNSLVRKFVFYIAYLFHLLMEGRNVRQHYFFEI